MLKKGMSNSGLSDVVTTVLILLIAIAAVAVVGGIVLGQIAKTKQSIEDSQLCTELGNSIGPTKCVYNPDTAQPAAVVIVFRQPSGQDLELKRVGVSVEGANGALRDSTILGTDLPKGQSKITAILIDAADTLIKAKVNPVFQAASGREILCPQLNAEVECEMRGVAKDETDPTSARITVDYSLDGVATDIYSIDAGGSGYEVLGVQTLKQIGTNGIAIVYVTSVNSGAVTNLQIIHGGSGWEGISAARLI